MIHADQIIKDYGIKLSDEYKERFTQIDICRKQIKREIRADLNNSPTPPSEEAEKAVQDFYDRLMEFSELSKRLLLTRHYADVIPEEVHFDEHNEDNKKMLNDFLLELTGKHRESVQPFFYNEHLGALGGFIHEKIGDMFWPIYPDKGEAGKLNQGHNVFKCTNHIIELSEFAEEVCKANPSLSSLAGDAAALKGLAIKWLNREEGAEETFRDTLSAFREALEEHKVPVKSKRAIPATNARIEKIEFALEVMENTADERSTQLAMFEFEKGTKEHFR